MAWFSRITRFGDVHWVFGQENTIACGVACVIMAVFKAYKLTPGKKAVFDEKTILSKATALLGPNPLGTAGLDNPKLVQLLNHPDLKMPGWKLETLASSQVPKKIMDVVGVRKMIGPSVTVTPIILGIDWNSNGGHWVLVDTVRQFAGKKYATVCDPWDANVHITDLVENQAFSYTAKPVSGFDVWGKRHKYDSPSVGGVYVGDVIYRT